MPVDGRAEAAERGEVRGRLHGEARWKVARAQDSSAGPGKRLEGRRAVVAALPAEASAHQDRLVEGTQALDDVLQTLAVEEIERGPGEDGRSARGPPGCFEQSDASSLEPRRRGCHEPARHHGRTPNQGDRVQQAHAHLRHLGRALGADVHPKIVDRDGLLRRSGLALHQVDRREDDGAGDPTAGAADHDRLSLMGLVPERARERAAGRNEPQVAIVMDPADDEARLAHGAGHQPPGRARADGEDDIAQCIPACRKPREPVQDELGRWLLAAHHRGDLQEGLQLVFQGDGAGWKNREEEDQDQHEPSDHARGL